MAESDWTEATTLDEYQARINTFVESQLREYITGVESLPVGRKPPKEFNDPVWGTVSLSGLEVIILDSPLLQRLRRIRQLGVAHYVYTGANHTRIDHSIGVSHQINAVAEAVIGHARDLGSEADVARFATLVPTLRLTGLCHDVGHGLMSHVVEHALSTNRRATSLTRQFQQLFNKSVVQLSEVAAYYILLSPAFGDLLKAAQVACEIAHTPETPKLMANLVAGLKVVNHIPLLHELVSGPFDADKMDYLKRDALMCGVPVVTDIERLVQKVRATSKSREDLPDQIKPTVNVDQDDRFLLIGVARSGARALDELALGRSLMFDKVYRHQKVRAVEAMVGKVVAAVGPALASSAETLPLEVHDDEFIDLDADAILRGAVKHGVDADGLDVEGAAELTRRLRRRDLFVRATAFASKSPFDEAADQEVRRLRNRNFVTTLRKPAGRAAFVAAITEVLREIAGVVGREDDLAALPGNLDSYVAVNPPTNDPSNQGSVEVYAYLIDESGKVIPVSQSNADLTAWTAAYGNTRDIGYVYSPRTIADMVHVAAEYVMRRDHSVRMPHQLSAWTKSDDARIEALKENLSSGGFYKGTLRALGTPPAELKAGDFPDRLDAIRDRFQGYQGPAVADSEKAKGEVPHFDKRAVLEWAQQFPPELTPLAISLLERVLLISRARVVEAVSSYMTQNGFEEAVVAPLGDEKDGSSIVAYYAGDLQDQLNVRVVSVPEALTQNAPIILIDDFLGVGNSSISIVEKLLGEKPTTKLNEQRFKELAEPAKQLFRDVRLNFVFVGALDEGKQNLLARGERLGLDLNVWSLIEQGDLPSLDDMSDLPLFEEFRLELQRIGEQIHSDTADYADKDPALGYGGRGMLVTTTFNTPTVTVSALWKSGKVDDEDWNPLFPRRPKR